MRRRAKVKLPKIKTDIKDFLLNDEGKITQKNIFKMGMSLIAVGMLFTPTQAMAQHTNTFFSTGRGGHNSHNSHGSHSSHGSHGSY